MMKLGAIADDLTGATDLGIALTNAGFKTAVIPEAGLTDLVRREEATEVDAIVVALKTRTSAVPEAVERSLRALRWLQSSGCDRFYFKYCSTFDSTAEGNIGPVTENLLDALGEPLTVIAPAFPATGRTVYQGHLFVHELPLHESSLRDHPLTPMRDSSIPRLLSPQVRDDSHIELLDLQTILRGAEAVKTRIDQAARAGSRFLVADSIDQGNLQTLAQGCSGLRLLTGGSGLAEGLVGPHTSGAVTLSSHRGRRIVLSGSASKTTQAQVQHALQMGAGMKIDTAALHEDFSGAVAGLFDAALASDPARPFVVYATASPQDVVSTGDADLIEMCLSTLAQQLAREESVTALVVAGGETSGAVVDALSITAMKIGPQLSPGVAWIQAQSADSREFTLVLKSGNFGDEDLFIRAWDATC